jgi:DNA-binding transcriptional ArsR family regulator
MLNHRELDLIFRALGDTSRRSIIERLARGPAPVKELAGPLAMSLPAVMQHLQVLQEAGLIRTEKVGRVRTCSLESAALRQSEQWLAGQRTDAERQLDALGSYLQDHDDQGESS